MEILSKDKKANIEVRVFDKIRQQTRTLSLYAPNDTAETVRDKIRSLLNGEISNKEVDKRGVQ